MTHFLRSDVTTLGGVGSDAGKQAACTSEVPDCVLQEHPHTANFHSFFENDLALAARHVQSAPRQPKNLTGAEAPVTASRSFQPLAEEAKVKEKPHLNDLQVVQIQHVRSSYAVLDHNEEQALFALPGGRENSANSALPQINTERSAPDIPAMNNHIKNNDLSQFEGVRDAFDQSSAIVTLQSNEGKDAWPLPQGLVALPQSMQENPPKTPVSALPSTNLAQLKPDSVAHHPAPQNNALPVQQGVTQSNWLLPPVDGQPKETSAQGVLVSQPQAAPDRSLGVSSLGNTLPETALTFGHDAKRTPVYRSADSLALPQPLSANLPATQPESMPVIQARFDPKTTDNLPPSMPEATKVTQTPTRGAEPLIISQMVMSPAPPPPAGMLAGVSHFQVQAGIIVSGDHSEGTEWPIGMTQSQANMIANSAVGSSPSNVARQIAQQILPASFTSVQGAVDIQLNPEALGRVRINMSMTDGAMVMNIQAERLETLDLMRRNIDQLAQEFRQIGYDSISFSFGQNANQGHDIENPIPTDKGEAIDSNPLQPSLQNLAQGISGLDIRV